MISRIKALLFFSFGIGAVIVWSGSSWQGGKSWNDNTPIYELLEAFGEKLPDHARKENDTTKIRRGYDLIHYGRTVGANGKKSKYISKFYVCTSCHNPVRENPDLANPNPDDRLEYAIKNNLKFLQGTTFFGIANRESWYNGDYVLKYGDLVKPANKSLSESTQLCAKVCSSGRYLEDWELEAILAYYWSNQISLGDLTLDKDEKNKILQAAVGDQPELIQLIKSKYALKSPATFGHSPSDKSKGYSFEGNPDNGAQLYKLACQACHQKEGVAGMPLENNRLAFNKFKRNMTKHNLYNIYDIVRHGTYTDKGKPRYMPHYTKERMSDQQLEDLRAFIEREAS